VTPARILGALCALMLLAPARAAAAPSFTDAAGLHVTATKQFDSRDFNVKVDSRAAAGRFSISSTGRAAVRRTG
jgi:hypothetical protein